MATVTIRNLDPIVKERLRVRAAQHGHSMQAEVRKILGEAVGAERDSEVNLAEAIRRRFATFGGVEDLTVHPPVPVREPPIATPKSLLVVGMQVTKWRGSMR